MGQKYHILTKNVTVKLNNTPKDPNKVCVWFSSFVKQSIGFDSYQKMFPGLKENEYYEIPEDLRLVIPLKCYTFSGRLHDYFFSKKITPVGMIVVREKKEVGYADYEILWKFEVNNYQNVIFHYGYDNRNNFSFVNKTGDGFDFKIKSLTDYQGDGYSQVYNISLLLDGEISPREYIQPKYQTDTMAFFPNTIYFE